MGSDGYLSTEPLSVAQVEAAMKNVKVIKNYLAVIVGHKNLTSLSMFRRLEDILGNQLFR
jgi:hypothetical protein